MLRYSRGQRSASSGRSVQDSYRSSYGSTPSPKCSLIFGLQSGSMSGPASAAISFRICGKGLTPPGGYSTASAVCPNVSSGLLDPLACLRESALSA